MNLATHTQNTANEIQQVKQILGLIKGDVSESDPRTPGFVPDSDLEHIKDKLELSERIKQNLESELEKMKLREQDTRMAESKLQEVTRNSNLLIDRNEALEKEIHLLQTQIAETRVALKDSEHKREEMKKSLFQSK